MPDLLVCYRGASASDWEIDNYKKNVGEIIQNLGFLSTSTDKNTAKKFLTNLMIVITIEKK